MDFEEDDYPVDDLYADDYYEEEYYSDDSEEQDSVPGASAFMASQNIVAPKIVYILPLNRKNMSSLLYEELT